MQIRHRFAHNDIISLTGEAVRYDLAESVGPDLTLGRLLAEGGGEALDQLALGYGPTAGSPELRKLLAQRHGVAADDVVVMAGGMQALFLAAFILCEPGDDVVLGTPLFPNAKTVLTAVGATLRELPFAFEEGYRLNVEKLKAALTPETKLVSLASPQNPSGVALTRSEVTAILACMEKTCPGAVLLVDETYREAAYGDDDVRESVAGLDPRILSCASLSKCHGAPGLRIGWAITGHPALREQLILGKFNTTICNSGVDEALARRVLERQSDILAQRRGHLKAGLDRVAAMTARHQDLVEWVRPDAGALCCLRLKEEAFDAAAVARFYEALRARDVRVGPGPWFGEEDRVFRLGFGLLALADLEEALSRLATALLETRRLAA